MSPWTLGANDVSEETRSLRDKLASKDGQIAAQEDKLLKQEADLEELRERLNETLHKLASETGRATELEADIRRRSEELRNERIVSENARNALSNALEKHKESNRELRDLEATLERLSYTSNEHQAHWAKAEKEKTTLDARVKELEAQLRTVSPPSPAFTPGRRIPKPRSSSLSNIKINTLEQDLTGLRSQLANKGAEIEIMSQKLSRALQDQIKAENERVASERNWRAQTDALQAAMNEKEEELAFMREQGGDGSREDELLKRIEEDDAKIAALEMMLRNADDSKEYKEKLRRLEIHLNEERQQRKHIEERCLAVSRERDGALNALGEARQEAAGLARELEERQLRDDDFEERASRSLKTWEEPTSDDYVPQADTISHLEKLLVAVDRLRVERDGLRRDLAFLESESRFTIEALERKLASSSVSVYSDTDTTVKTLDQMKHEMDELHAHLNEVTEDYTARLNSKNSEICRLGLYLEGLAVAFNRMSSSEQSSLTSPDDQAIVKSLEEKYDVTVLCLEAMTSQRDDLLVQLQTKNAEWEKEIRLAQHDIDELKKAVDELNAHIDHIESERDSLALQVTNLTTDLQNAQDELTNAESRYTSLQFHQLSNMTSNEATRTLREHIEELEARVMRRTEQIGIHQHDIRRLETNLRLQEERLSEMMAELEMMAAQKDAMVEDCADAREARDEALARVEALEEEMEAGSENERLVTDLIAVVVDTAARARKAIQDNKESATHREEALQVTVAGLESQIGDMQQSHDVSIRNLLQQHEELESRLKDYEKTHVNNENNEKQVAELKLQHAEAIAPLQQRLADNEAAFKDLQIRHKSAEVDHQIAMEEATSLIKELEDQLETTKKYIEDLQESQSKFHLSEQGHAERVAELEKELKQASEDYRNVLQASDTIEKEKCELENMLNKMKDDHECLLANVRDEYLGSQRDLENRLETLQKDAEDNVRLLDAAKAEIADLTPRLREEVEGRTMDREEYALTLESINQQSGILKEQLQGVQRDLHDVQSKLQLAERQVRNTDDEKTGLQQDITTLGAEIQKLKSINRYLESQSKESDHVVTSLRGEVEHLRLELAHSEKACKAAEVNLSLQNAQHKRETSGLQREVSSLRRMPNLETALRELEERNNEMEELLRSKCAEIEANDDRVLEMMKEKKKFSTKVESLNRKIQNLQAKLAAAKASNTAQQFAPKLQESPGVSNSNAERTPISVGVPESRPRALTIAQTPSLPSSLPQIPPVRTMNTRNSIQRFASGSSSLPKPKTPERNRMPVFKARTPERLEVDLIPENTVIGKKRAAPDDFEAVENIPAHAYLADGKDAENRTPRVRRVLSSLQSSFTPNRNSNRPPVPSTSPKRPELPLGTAHMTNMTNSPFALPPVAMSSAKPSKRSWLGKIRGASQVVDRPSSNARNFFGPGEPS